MVAILFVVVAITALGAILVSIFYTTPITPEASPALAGGASGIPASSDSSDGAAAGVPTAPAPTETPIGLSSSSPSDKIQQFAEAIAYAEGFWDRNRNVLTANRPARDNNPGDIEGVGDAGGHDGAYAIFSTVAKGWAKLYAQVQLDFSGKSQVYSPTMTISDYAWTYTATAQDSWSESVASWLDVSRDIKISDWLAS